MLGDAPDLDIAVKAEADRHAARMFMNLLAAADGEWAAVSAKSLWPTLRLEKL